MASPMLKMLKSKYPDKEYPLNTGQKWTNEEDTLLFKELGENIDIQLIAQSHNRTIGGINARRKEIAYKLYSNNETIKEIISKTKLSEEQLIETIKKKTNKLEGNPVIKIDNQLSIEINKIKNDIKETKNDIKEMKNSIKELVEMIKSIYEFEDV